MNVLALIDKLYGGAAVRTEPALCLNSRSHKSGCSACVSACPVGAIQLGGGGQVSVAPALDPLACKGCGLCEPVCPTGVFALKETAGLLPKLGEGRLASLTCSASQREDRVKVACLAGLPAETLAAAAVGRTLLLEAPDACAACAVGGHHRLGPLVAEAERVLAAFGLTGTVRLVFGSRAAEAAAEAAAAANQLDRRQFLNFARMGLMAAATTVVKPEPEAATLQDLPAQVPQGRRHFLTAVRKQPGSGSVPALSERGSLRFAGVKAAPGCDGCGACTASCPSGALSFRREEGTDRLIFAADRCVACALCVEGCPHGLLALDERFDPSAVFVGVEETLARLSVARCNRCGQEFHGAGDYCRECQKVSSLLDGFLGR